VLHGPPPLELAASRAPVTQKERRHHLLVPLAPLSPTSHTPKSLEQPIDGSVINQKILG
jgi:hypothetical protein